MSMAFNEDFQKLGVIMKPLPVIWIALLVCACTNQVREPEKYVPRNERLREKFSTPEPGTYLKPMAFTLLNGINRVMEDPVVSKQPPDWIKNVFVVPQKRLVDTVFSFREHSVPVRIYYPTKRSLSGHQPVILFIHGGGFVLGSVDEYHILVSKLARITGQVVVSVDYRLAPENPFPAGLEDCYAVLCCLQEHGDEIGIDTARINLIGDSAGGNLATVLTLMCRDRGRHQPHSQVLIYPGVTFQDTLFDSRIYFGLSDPKSYVLTENFLLNVKARYLRDPSEELNPYVSPLLARLSADLAPALVITAECDPIRDGGRLYAKKLALAGVPVEHIEYSGMIHGFMSFHMILREAVDAMKYIGIFLDRN
jgi:acetyl esterase